MLLYLRITDNIMRKYPHRTLIKYMKPSQLIKFRMDRKWNKTKMAKQVGISRDTLSRYEMQPETKSIPLGLSLSCSAIAWGLLPFGDRYTHHG